MATKTLGSNATTTLTAMTWNPAAAVADIASIQALILDDGMPFSAGGSAAGGSSNYPLGVQPHHIAGGSVASQIPGSFLPNGQLIIPNRGILRLLPGDWVGVDANGWPILLSAAAIAGTYVATSWTHS